MNWSTRKKNSRPSRTNWIRPLQKCPDTKCLGCLLNVRMLLNVLIACILTGLDVRLQKQQNIDRLCPIIYLAIFFSPRTHSYFFSLPWLPLHKYFTLFASPISFSHSLLEILPTSFCNSVALVWNFFLRKDILVPILFCYHLIFHSLCT